MRSASAGKLIQKRRECIFPRTVGLRQQLGPQVPNGPSIPISVRRSGGTIEKLRLGEYETNDGGTEKQPLPATERTRIRSAQCLVAEQPAASRGGRNR